MITLFVHTTGYIPTMIGFAMCAFRGVLDQSESNLILSACSILGGECVVIKGVNICEI